MVVGAVVVVVSVVVVVVLVVLVVFVAVVFVVVLCDVVDIGVPAAEVISLAGWSFPEQPETANAIAMPVSAKRVNPTYSS